MGKRDRYFAAVKARLERSAATGDASSVLEPAALAEAAQLTEALRAAGDEDDWEPLQLLGCLHWARYLALPEDQKQKELTAAIGLLAPCFIKGAGNPPGPLLPLLAKRAVPVATSMFERMSGTPGGYDGFIWPHQSARLHVAPPGGTCDGLDKIVA